MNEKTWMPCVLLLLSVASSFLLCQGFSDLLLQEFLKWNEVPTEVYLGLTSGKPEVETIQLINGTCFQYEPHEFERCKYYSDCCAMTPARPIEQLAPGTFSCHGGFYLVDKCPAGTQDEQLTKSCEGTAESGKWMGVNASPSFTSFQADTDEYINK